MTPAKIYTYDIPSGGNVRLPIVGRFFKILSCTGTVDLKTENADLSGLLSGDGLQDTPFSYISLTDKSGAANNVRFVVADQAFINAPQTNTAITANKNTQVGGITATNPAVTAASSQALAANAARQYLLIKNEDGALNLWIRAGAAATQALGIKVPPGGYWEWDSTIPTQAIHLIADGNNNNVKVWEG